MTVDEFFDDSMRARRLRQLDPGDEPRVYNRLVVECDICWSETRRGAELDFEQYGERIGVKLCIDCLWKMNYQARRATVDGQPHLEYDI